MRCICDDVGAYVADNLLWGSASHHVDDIVERGASAGCIVACFERDDGLFAVRVEIFRFGGVPMRYIPEFKNYGQLKKSEK